jgi:uncharacterized protein
VTAVRADVAPAPAADPRPVVVEEQGRHLLAGGRCLPGGHALGRPLPRCPRCRGEVAPARFGPDGAVWAVTVVHVPAQEGDEVPYTLAYVDLDAGPRLLVRLDESLAPARVGARVRLTASSPAGDPAAEMLP